MIHPTAWVDASVQVPESCTIGPFCVIERGVQLGPRVVLGSQVVLKSGVCLGEEVQVHSHAVVGDDPQISGQRLDFENGVQIGARTVLREGVTIHRASQPHQWTRIGSDCLFMAFSHVGHDTTVGDHCILANLALLAGCVTVGPYAFLSGGSMVQQFVQIGESAFLSGNAEISMHVPPFVTVMGRNEAANINVVGLQRRGFSSEEVADIKQRYRWMYDGTSLSFQKRARQALEEKQYTTDRGRQFLSFFTQSMPSRGFVYPRSRRWEKSS